MPDPALNPAEEKTLRTLWNRGARSRSELRPGPGVLERLIKEGWVTEVPPPKTAKRGTTKFVLSETGRLVAARVPPSKPTTADVYREISALREEVRELKALLSVRSVPVEPLEKVHADSTTPQPFDVALRAALGELDRQSKYGGLIPIPELRRALSGMGLSRAQFDTALLEQERVYTIDLKVANDPQKLRDPEHGISVEGRGVLYYAVLR